MSEEELKQQLEQERATVAMLQKKLDQAVKAERDKAIKSLEHIRRFILKAKLAYLTKTDIIILLNTEMEILNQCS